MTVYVQMNEVPKILKLLVEILITSRLHWWVIAQASDRAGPAGPQHFDARISEGQ